MSLRVHTNAPSYGVHRQMVNNHRTQEKTLEQQFRTILATHLQELYFQSACTRTQ